MSEKIECAIVRNDDGTQLKYCAPSVVGTLEARQVKMAIKALVEAFDIDFTDVKEIRLVAGEPAVFTVIDHDANDKGRTFKDIEVEYDHIEGDAK